MTREFLRLRSSRPPSLPCSVQPTASVSGPPWSPTFCHQQERRQKRLPVAHGAAASHPSVPGASAADRWAGSLRKVHREAFARVTVVLRELPTQDRLRNGDGFSRLLVTTRTGKPAHGQAKCLRRLTAAYQSHPAGTTSVEGSHARRSGVHHRRPQTINGGGERHPGRRVLWHLRQFLSTRFALNYRRDGYDLARVQSGDIHGRRR